MIKKIKELLIEALDNPYDTFELGYVFYLTYEEGLQEDYFTGDFILRDKEDNYLNSYDLSTYWNTQSEILTMGNKILEDIAQEIFDYINK